MQLLTNPVSGGTRRGPVSTGPRPSAVRSRFVAAITIAVLAASFFAVGGLTPTPTTGSREVDAKAFAVSALDHIQRARNDADPSHYSQAEDLLIRSLELTPANNFEASVGQAALANARHDFSASVGWADRAIAINPHSAAPYGLLGDALFELGRYGSADRAYQKMIDVRPDLGSYVRASYALQYRGQSRRAIGAMRLALESAGPTGSSPAWIRHQLGDIYLGMGRLNEAARQNRIGTRIAPEFVPPTVGLAEVHIARGRLGRATKIVGRAAAALPSIEYLATLAELYDATGREQLAKSSYAAVDEKIQDYRAAGVLPDVDFILFYADRKLHLDKTLAEARAMYEVRPTAAVSDALAWTLHALGRDEEALPFALDAAGVAPQDPLIDLHAAVIADALGKSKTATTLARGAAKLAWTLPPTRVAELHRLLAQMATTRS
jgi:hypothetical protein